jgi:hypothetical protein
MKPLEYLGDIAEMEEWTAEQAAYYSCGFEPVECGYVSKHGDVDGVMGRNVELFKKVADKLPPRDWVLWARSYGINFLPRLAHMVELHVGETLWPEDGKQVIPTQPIPAPAEVIDDDTLATADQLIYVFGQCAGVDKAWFNKDKGWTKAGRIIDGTPGKNGTKALYSVQSFIEDCLLDQKRKFGDKDKVVTAKQVWGIFRRSSLSHIYDRLQHLDPTIDG